MKTSKALTLGIFLAAILLLLQAPPAVRAQDQDQDQSQNQPQDQDQNPAQDQNQPPAQVQDQNQDQDQDQTQDQYPDQNQPPDQAQGPDQDQAQPDPPSRVARLNYSSGSVSFQPGGEGDWVEAVSNRPLTTGDNLWADKDSRAELHIGSTALRMDSETSLTFLELDDHVVQLRLSAGSLIVRLEHLDDGDTYEIDTPNLAFELQRPGDYRIDVNADGNETITTVRSGRGEATGGGDSYTVIAGQRARFSGTDQLDHEINQLPRRDDFEQWAYDRDQRDDRSESANYISPEMTGSEDLDDYGRWQYAAAYGPVWYPTQVVEGWAPYRYGHWVWVRPWGWTWVEDEPWGFAPFHYGRWVFVERRWGWIPGPVVVRPVYAPALVAFVGGGGFRVGIGIGGPGVAWFPLGPGEVYVPPYRVSRVYVNNVNITNTRVNVVQVTNVYNIYNSKTNVRRITYMNQRIPSAVTAVSRETFVSARPVARNLARVDAREMAEARVTRNLEVEPAKASVLGAGRPVSMRPPLRVVERPVIAIHNPPPPRASLPATRNARIEKPQPAPRAPNEAPRAAQPDRGREPAQPAPTARPQERSVPRPPAAGRAREAPPASRPQPPARPEDRNTPRPGSPAQDRSSPYPQAARPESSHPLVRPAPPVQNKPDQQRTEEQKFRTWQDQRQKQSPPPRQGQAPKPDQRQKPEASRPPDKHAPDPKKPDKQ